jgi:hypothetical protein
LGGGLLAGPGTGGALADCADAHQMHRSWLLEREHVRMKEYDEGREKQIVGGQDMLLCGETCWREHRLG